MTNSPTAIVSALCRQAIQRKVDYNLHFFVNSVACIAQVIQQAQLQPDQVRLVCSTSGDVDQKNREKLGARYPIGSTKDPVKRVNFYTSTSFEGCDIYDPVGKTYIVSEGHREHTLLDISTTFRQVCGRLRDTQYEGQVTLIFSSSYTGNTVTVSDFAAATLRSYRNAQGYCQMVNQMSDQERELHHQIHAKTTLLNEQYISKENGLLRVDIDRLRFEIARFRLKNKVYTTSYNMRNELTTSGIRLRE